MSRWSPWFERNDLLVSLAVVMTGILVVSIVTSIDDGSDDEALARPTMTFGPTPTDGPCGTCETMTSCDQARRCLAAGHTHLDRDGDGTPCESICR